MSILHGSNNTPHDAGEANNASQTLLSGSNASDNSNVLTLIQNAEQAAPAMQGVLDHQEGSTEQGSLRDQEGANGQGNWPTVGVSTGKEAVTAEPDVSPDQGAPPGQGAPTGEEVVTVGPSVPPSQGSPPGQGAPPGQGTIPFKLIPSDYSDTGQALLLWKLYKDKLRCSPSLGPLVYTGSRWDADEMKARSIVHELTSKQLAEAEAEVERCKQVMEQNGAWRVFETSTSIKALKEFSSVQRASYDEYARAEEYRRFVVQKRNSAGITAALREVQSMLHIETDDLDKDPFLLNTPDGTVDLRTGVMRPHDPADYITKQTAVGPSDVGMDIWLDALNTFFCNDQDLIDYVQEVAGLMAIGKVFVECIICASGSGKNGKSSAINSLAKVLGTYAGTLSADTLTAGCRRNVKPELATAKGKRLLVAAELDEGERFNSSVIKTLASTDKIHAEPKYLQPFSFEPSHMTVLYTNHLPRMSARDGGLIRRLVVLPFNAVIDSKSDIKNFSEYLFQNAGGAIMKWIIEGAVKIIAKDYKLTLPSAVQAATEQYRAENDWLAAFLETCCDTDDPTSEEKAGEVYAAYRYHCSKVGEYVRTRQDFNAAMEAAEYTRRRTNKGVLVRGLQLKQEYRNC